MEEAPENDKESSHSEHVNEMNELHYYSQIKYSAVTFFLHKGQRYSAK